MIISRDTGELYPTEYRRVQVPQEHFLGTFEEPVPDRVSSYTGLSMIISRDTLSGTGSSRTFLGYSYVVYRFVNDNIARYSVGYRFLKNISWVLLCRIQVCQ